MYMIKLLLCFGNCIACLNQNIPSSYSAVCFIRYNASSVRKINCNILTLLLGSTRWKCAFNDLKAINSRFQGKIMFSLERFAKAKVLGEYLKFSFLFSFAHKFFTTSADLLIRLAACAMRVQRVRHAISDRKPEFLCVVFTHNCSNVRTTYRNPRCSWPKNERVSATLCDITFGKK